MAANESIENIVSEFRKSLQEDGGDIEFVDEVNGVVKVKLTRTTVPVTFSKFLRDHKTREGIGCGKCRIPTSTIIKVLESELKRKVPGITEVQVVK